jgi:hypothetical protein
MVTLKNRINENGSEQVTLFINDTAYASVLRYADSETCSIKAMKKGIYPYEIFLMDTELDIAISKAITDTLAALSKISKELNDLHRELFIPTSELLLIGNE